MEKRTDIDLNEYLKNQKKQQKYMESVFQVIKEGMEKLKNEKDRVQFEYVGGINAQSQQIEVFNKNNITNLRLYDEEGKLYFNDVDMTPEKGFDKLFFLLDKADISFGVDLIVYDFEQGKNKFVVKTVVGSCWQRKIYIVNDYKKIYSHFVKNYNFK